MKIIFHEQCVTYFHLRCVYYDKSISFCLTFVGGGSVNNAAYCGNSVALDHKSGVNLFSVEHHFASNTTALTYTLPHAFTEQALSFRAYSSCSVSVVSSLHLPSDNRTLLLPLSHKELSISRNSSTNQSYSYLNNPYSSLFFAFSRTDNVSKEDSG